MPWLSRAVLVGAAAAVSWCPHALAECPPGRMQSLTVEDVQRLLSVWDVDRAFGADFVAQQVNGNKLSLMLGLENAVNPAAYTKAQPFDWLALRHKYAACADEQEGAAVAAATAFATKLKSKGGRRRLASEDESASGLHIRRSNACVYLGEDADVTTCRTDDSELTVDADTFIVKGDLKVDGHVYLTNGGDVNAANVAELVLLVSTLQDTVARLQDQIDRNAADIGTNRADIDTLFDKVAVLDYAVNPAFERVVYESDFEETISEWDFHGKDLQTLLCGTHLGLGGNLETGDFVSLYLDSLPPHSELTVSFTFMAIDEWDGERASSSVDGAEIWYDVFDTDDATAVEVCGGDAGHEDNLAVVSKTFEHFGLGAEVVFTATIDELYDDETWAVADVSVKATLDEKYKAEYVSDFAGNDAAGWEFLTGDEAVTTLCGKHSVLGGFNVTEEAYSLVKTLQGMDDHTELVIAFEFVKIDDWEGE